MPAAFATGDVKVNDFSATIQVGMYLYIYILMVALPETLLIGNGQFKNVETGAITHSTLNVTTVHNFGKAGGYDVTLTVWGPTVKIHLQSQLI